MFRAARALYDTYTVIYTSRIWFREHTFRLRGHPDPTLCPTTRHTSAGPRPAQTTNVRRRLFVHSRKGASHALQGAGHGRIANGGLSRDRPSGVGAGSRERPFDPPRFPSSDRRDDISHGHELRVSGVRCSGATGWHVRFGASDQLARDPYSGAATDKRTRQRASVGLEPVQVLTSCADRNYSAGTRWAGRGLCGRNPLAELASRRPTCARGRLSVGGRSWTRRPPLGTLRDGRTPPGLRRSDRDDSQTHP